jgi:hypothetical protein
VALSIVMAFSTGLANVSLKYNRYKILSLTSHLIWNHSLDLSMSKHKGDWLPTNKRRWRSNELGCLSNRNLNLSVGFSSVGFYQMAKIAVTPTIVLAEFLVLERRVSFNKVFSFKPFLLHKGHCQWR